MFRQCRFSRLQKLQIRSYYDSRTHVPRKGDKGELYHPALAAINSSSISHPVVVAMSGGVDSSVTAKLLADKVSIICHTVTTDRFLYRQDYDLSAVFMRNWDTRDESGSDHGCEWEKDWEDVRRVCGVLDIPCKMVCFIDLLLQASNFVYSKVDLSREYWTRVFEPSLKSWERGITPNPDVWCNK